MFYLLRVEKSQEAILLSSVEFWNTQGAGNLGLVGQSWTSGEFWLKGHEPLAAPWEQMLTLSTLRSVYQNCTTKIEIITYAMPQLACSNFCEGWTMPALWFFFVILFVFSHCSKICVCLLAEMCFLVLPNQSHQGASVWQGLRPQAAVNFLLKVHIPKLTSTYIVTTIMWSRWIQSCAWHSLSKAYFHSLFYVISRGFKIDWKHKNYCHRFWYFNSNSCDRKVFQEEWQVFVQGSGF